MFNRYNQRVKAKLIQNKVKKELDVIENQDCFWDENELKEAVQASYYAIQVAWSNQDFHTLQEYLTPDLLKQWQVKMNWQNYKGHRNVLTNIRLLKNYVVDFNDSVNDDEDYLLVYIEGKMNDQLIDENSVIIESNKDVFVEYWKFKIQGKKIYLDCIYQSDEFEC